MSSEPKSECDPTVKSWESVTFLEAICSGKIGPTYLAKIIDADIITIKEICNYMIGKVSLNLNKALLESLMEIIIERRPDLFDDKVGVVFLLRSLQIRSSPEFTRQVIEQSGCVVSRELVPFLPFDLFMEFFDNSIDIGELVTLGDGWYWNHCGQISIDIDQKVAQFAINSFIATFLPADMSENDLVNILNNAYCICYNDAYIVIADIIIDQRSDWKNILKMHISSVQYYDGLNALFKHMALKNVSFDPIEEDHIQCLYLYIEGQKCDTIGISPSALLYQPYISYCVPDKAMGNRSDVYQLIKHRWVGIKGPLISEDKLEALLSPYGVSKLSFDEDSQLLSDIIGLMEEDQAINQFIRDNPDLAKDPNYPDCSDY